MTQFNNQIPIQKLADVVDALPSITILNSQHDADEFWSILFTVDENSAGWQSLKILTGAITPPDDAYPKIELRCLALSPRDQIVFTISPVARGVDPDLVTACVEAQSVIRFRRSGLGGVLN